MTRKHAVLSASGAHRWLNCTPSARLEDPIPDQSSVFAAEGTLAHDLGELLLKKELKTVSDSEFAAQFAEIEAHELYFPDMLDQVQKYVDFALEQFAEAKTRSKDAILFLEQRLDFSRWVPEGFGTGDCTIISDGVMEIIDFKFGKGVEVYAEENPQMKLYALGALDSYGFIYEIGKVRMTVHQPRIDNISSWEIAVSELLSWAESELAPKAKMAWEGEGEAFAGDWCRFCKVKARCKVRAEQYQAVPNAFSYQSPELLTAEDIARILADADAIQAWAKDVQEFALEQARDHGVKFEGWKLVEGRSNRRYTDTEQVEKKLRSAKYKVADIFKPREILGITAMEKLLGKSKFKDLLADLVEKPPGKPALVASTDKRPELNSAALDFDL